MTKQLKLRTYKTYVEKCVLQLFPSAIAAKREKLAIFRILLKFENDRQEKASQLKVYLRTRALF